MVSEIKEEKPDSIKVLMVEDNEDDARFLSEILSESDPSDFQVIHADKLSKALKHLAYEDVDLILLDLGLPDSQGLSTLDRVKAQTVDVPIVIITGQNDEDMAIQAVKAGAQDYLVKGFLDGSLLNRSIRYGIERQHLIKELKQKSDKLHASRQSFHNIVEKSIDGIIVLDKSGVIHFANSAAISQLRLQPENILGSKFGYPIVNDEDTEIDILHKDGTTGTAEMRVIETLWEGEKASLALLRDVTERKRKEEIIKTSLNEKMILLKEIHHRVKNNLQIICSLLNLQSEYYKGRDSFNILKECQNRVRSMAMVHEQLYDSNDFARVDFMNYIESLALSLYQSYRIDPMRIELKANVEGIFMGIDIAIPCGLVINELVSNSLEHAFPPSRKEKGHIEIAMYRNRDDEIELMICDDGVGMPQGIDFMKTESLGLHLVNILVKDQLQGKVNLDNSKGTKFLIKFRS